MDSHLLPLIYQLPAYLLHHLESFYVERENELGYGN